MYALTLTGVFKITPYLLALTEPTNQFVLLEVQQNQYHANFCNKTDTHPLLIHMA